MDTEKKFTEYDQIGIPTAENVEIRREQGREHIVSILFTRPDGSRREVQVMSYGEPLSIYVEGTPGPELEGPTCDQCEERDDLTRWPDLRDPVTLCPSCEHDARRSGWEPGSPEDVARAAALAVSVSSSRPAVEYLRRT